MAAKLLEARNMWDAFQFPYLLNAIINDIKHQKKKYIMTFHIPEGYFKLLMEWLFRQLSKWFIQVKLKEFSHLGR